MDGSAAISELVIANRIVAHLRLVDSFGHVTIRNPENPETFFMSRARAPGLVTKEDILEFNLESTPLDLRGLRPYSERFIHGCLYKYRPDVTAICHNHAHELLRWRPRRPCVRLCTRPPSLGTKYPWDIRDHFGDTNMASDDERDGQLPRQRGWKGQGGADARTRKRGCRKIGTRCRIHYSICA